MSMLGGISGEEAARNFEANRHLLAAGGVTLGGRASAVDELIAFVRAQLDEDERVALAANPAPWRRITDRTWLDPNTIFGASYMGDQEKLRNVASIDISWCPDGNAEHITRWDPARVLAEVEAKRRILEIHHHVECRHDRYGPDGDCDECGTEWPCETVLVIAQLYAGREGWREEWAD